MPQRNSPNNKQWQKQKKLDRNIARRYSRVILYWNALYTQTRIAMHSTKTKTMLSVNTEHTDAPKIGLQKAHIP